MELGKFDDAILTPSDEVCNATLVTTLDFSYTSRQTKFCGRPFFVTNCSSKDYDKKRDCN